MAEGGVSQAESNKSTSQQSSEHTGDNLECAVCLQTCVFPAQLPCGHIFCFLCIKGIANQSKRCAMCRQEIPRDFLEHPKLLKCPNKTEDVEGEGYHWFYEGRNGWWQYDERTSKELEASYKKGERTCELLIAGFLYVADLEAMLQLRRNDPSRRRRIKRDLATVPKKGVAGLRTEEDEPNGYSQRNGTVEGRNDNLTEPITQTDRTEETVVVDEDVIDDVVDNDEDEDNFSPSEINEITNAIRALQSLRLHLNSNTEDSNYVPTDYRILRNNNHARHN